MKLLIENWREYMKENIAAVDELKKEYPNATIVTRLVGYAEDMEEGKKRSAAVKVPRKLYHASFGDAVRKIKSGGLKPGTSSTSLWFDHSSGFVYATSDPTDAFGYVEMYLEQSGMYDEDEPITVFEIDTAQTDLSGWEKDPWNDYPSIQSFAYAGNIPASELRVVRASSQ